MTVKAKQEDTCFDLEDVVERSRSGDDQAFAVLVRRYERPLIAYFLGFLGSPSEAEELAHESFVRAYLSLNKLARAKRFGPWLFGIARNCYREWSKDRKKRRQTPPSLDKERTAIIERKFMLHQEIYRIVQELPELYRELIMLRYYGGESSTNIAKILDRPVGTVTKQVSRAHALVAQHLKTLKGFTTLLHFMLPEEALNGS